MKKPQPFGSQKPQEDKKKTRPNGEIGLLGLERGSVGQRARSQGEAGAPPPSWGTLKHDLTSVSSCLLTGDKSICYTSYISGFCEK